MHALDVLPTLVICELLLAAYIDARWRRYPNWLFAATFLTELAWWFCALGDGTQGWTALFVPRLMWALGIAGVLLAFELLWRKFKRTPGLGMGDIKAMLCLAFLEPSAALASFIAGLLVLALVCTVLRKRSLPLLAFAMPIFVAFYFLMPFMDETLLLNVVI